MDRARLEQEAQRLGFDRVGVAPLHPPERDLQAYRAWLARGDHGGMGYMARPDRVERRADPTLILPGVRAVVSVAVNYYPGPPPPAGPLQGRVSNYAWSADYHDWMEPRLEELAAFIRRESGGKAAHRAYVDTGPILERAFAARAGLGFVGKNTSLIHPRMGSYLFLGELLVDVDLPPSDEVIPPRCGSCTRCLDACPTGALVAPHRLDARRCLSYLTIEHKGPIPQEMRPLVGNRVYGCDTCQVVCPYQRFARPTQVEAFRALSPEHAAPSLLEWMALDEQGFRARFEGTPLLRLKRARLLRNVAVALGNAGDPRAVPVLTKGLSDGEPLVRAHAAWALGRIGGREGMRALELACAWERDPAVQREIGRQTSVRRT